MCSRSPVFKSMLAADMLEKITGKIKLPDVSLKTGRQLRLNIDKSIPSDLNIILRVMS
jgi:hypothetical protein